MQTIANATRNRKIIAAMFAVLGLAAGLLSIAVHPPAYASSALVILSSQVKSVTAQAVIAQSDPVVYRAAITARVPFHRGSVKAQAIGPDIIAITARQPRAGWAQRDAQQVAVGYRLYVAAHSNNPRVAAAAAILQPAQPAKAVRTFSAFAFMGLLGLAVGAALGLLIMLFPPLSGGRTRVKVASA